MKAAPQIGPGTSGTRTSPAAPRANSGGNQRANAPAKPAPVDWFTAALNKNQNR
jgi:hypothetical protein